MPTPFTFVNDELPPIAYRVWFRYHDELLTATKQSKSEFRDFKSKSEAQSFQRTLQRSFPFSVACTTARYVTGAKRTAKLDARQHSIADDWPPQAKPLQAAALMEIRTGQAPEDESRSDSDESEITSKL